MFLVLVKSQQFSLFDMPVHVAGGTRKDGTVVKPHMRMQKVALKPHEQRSLFGAKEAESKPAKSKGKLDKFLTKHGGAARMKTLLADMKPEQRAKLIDAMAHLDDQKPSDVMALLGLHEDEAKPEPVKPDASPAAEPAAPAAPAHAIVEHVTKKGKTLRGIVRTDLTGNQAAEIDPYTFRRDGGWFIREKHLTDVTLTNEGKKQTPIKDETSATVDPALASASTVKQSLTVEQPSAPAVDKSVAQVAKLRAVADKLKADAQADMSRDRNTNTARRARMASSAEADASKRVATAETMHNLADAIESGEAKHLSGVSSRVAVESLDALLNNAMYESDKGLTYAQQQARKGRQPEPDDVRNAKLPSLQYGYGGEPQAKILERLKGKRGAKPLMDKIRSSSAPTPEIIDGCKKLMDDSDFRSAFGWYNIEQSAKLKRLAGIGITDNMSLRMALAEYIMFRSGAKKADPLKAAERDLIGKKVGFDFFPTPKALGERMAEMAGIKPGMSVLEPSAGNGNLADAARDAGGNVEVVEMSGALQNILKLKGHNHVATDFEDFEPGKQYDAIIMNPPFSDRKDALHIQRAYDMLKPGGKLVTIAGEGVFFGSDAKAKAFRDWLDERGADVEKLPEGTFNDKDLMATTGVNARLMTIEKPAEAGTATDTSPKEGDRNADGLVLRDGRWHREGEEAKPATPPAANPDIEAAEDREDLADELARNPHSEKAKELLRKVAEKHVPAVADSKPEPHSMSQSEFVAANPDMSQTRAEKRWATMVSSAIDDGKEIPDSVLNELVEKFPGFAPDGMASADVLLDRYKNKIDSGIESEITFAKEEHKKLAAKLEHKRTRTDVEVEKELHTKLKALFSEINSLEDEQFARKQGNLNGEFALRYVRRILSSKGVTNKSFPEGNNAPTRSELWNAKNNPSRSAPTADNSPKDGDRNAEGLVFRDGRWHREGEDNGLEKLRARVEELGGKELIGGALAKDKARADKLIESFSQTMGIAPEMVAEEFGLQRKPAQAAPRAPVTRTASGDGSDDPNSPNYRFADTGYVAGSRKELAAENIRKSAKSGTRVLSSEIDWQAIEQNPREAKELITKSNLFGKVDWEGLKAGGMDAGAGFLIDRVYASIGQEPSEESPQARKDYAIGLQSLRDRMEKCRTPLDVTNLLGEIRAEFDGKMMNAEDSEKYQAVRAVYDAEYDKLMTLNKNRDTAFKAYHSISTDLRTKEYEINKRTARKWKIPAEMQKEYDDLKAKHDPMQEKYIALAKMINEQRVVHEEGIKISRQKMNTIELAALARNKLENPIHRAWLLMGDRFISVMKYRGHKGSDAFAGHVTNAKNGKIDWSWAEKEGVSRQPKAATKGQVKFQLKVADTYTRVGGRDVTATSTADLKTKFGLRDVQSGNWVLKDVNSAKFHTEQSAMALADLADVLGVDDTQIAMNGRVALAFGARGSGSKGWSEGAARAHYEGVQRIINLTKMGGGGALGHELFHAIDNLTGEAETGKAAGSEDFFTENPMLLPAGELRDAAVNLISAMHAGSHQASEVLTYTAHDVDVAKHNIDRGYLSPVARLIKSGKDASAAVQAVDGYFEGKATTTKAKRQWKQWRTLAVAYHGGNSQGGEMKVTAGPTMSAFAVGAAQLDEGSKNPYWSESHEMAARAFQSYIEDKLEGMGRKNDYLSQYADNKYHIDPLFGIEWKPYPEGDERVKINAAFDRLFAAMRDNKTMAKAFGLLAA